MCSAVFRWPQVGVEVDATHCRKCWRHKLRLSSSATSTSCPLSSCCFSITCCTAPLPCRRVAGSSINLAPEALLDCKHLSANYDLFGLGITLHLMMCGPTYASRECTATAAVARGSMRFCDACGLVASIAQQLHDVPGQPLPMHWLQTLLLLHRLHSPCSAPPQHGDVGPVPAAGL